MSNQSKEPRTKSAALNDTGNRNPSTGGLPAGERRTDHKDRNPDLRSTEPDAAETNYQHPSSPGQRVTVPGAGVLRGGSDAYPIESNPDANARTAPGAGPCDAPQAAPGGKRRGTQPAQGGSPPHTEGAGVVSGSESPLASEAVTAGGAAPLNPPPDQTGLEPAVSDELPGIADPNFPTDKDRPENRDM